MAPNATDHRPGRTAGLICSLLLRPEHLAFTLAVEVYLFLLDVPPSMHLLVGALLHLVLAAISSGDARAARE